MTSYIVYFTATASHAVPIEADSEGEAIDKAFDEAFPYFPGGMDGDLGEWDFDSAEVVD